MKKWVWTEHFKIEKFVYSDSVFMAIVVLAYFCYGRESCKLMLGIFEMTELSNCKKKLKT